MAQLNTFHLFAGAGGGILADLLLGHNPIGACEIEPYPRDVLLARQRDGILPNFPIWDDVATLDGNPWRGTVDVLCGGFPCQDISTQGANHGAKKGINGERSGLWREYARLISEMRPRFIFAENSPNIRTKGLVTVLKDITSMGYDARWGKLGASDVGADHHRKRIWILAYRPSNRLERRNNCDTKGSGYTTPRPVAALCENQAWNDLPSPDAFGASNGMASKLDRLKAIGNGQVPQCAALAFSILSEGVG